MDGRLKSLFAVYDVARCFFIASVSQETHLQVIKMRKEKKLLDANCNLHHQSCIA